MKVDTLIVGAGLAGVTAARILAERGNTVLVVERLRHVGGHCHDRRNEAGITVHNYGPHIFHTVDREVWEFVNRFSPFRPYQHRVLSYAEGRLYPFPINVDTVNRIFGTGLATSELKDFLRQQVEKAQVPGVPANFRDAVVSQAGERLYELFFKNYTRKQWERDPEELSADLAKRVPIRYSRDDRYFTDTYQGIPLKGYTGLVENMLDHPGIRLLLNTDYFDIEGDISADVTVYTGELDRFFDYKYGELEYRSLDFAFETLEIPQYQPAAVVNYPNDYGWTRITEYKHFSGEQSPKTTISYEYPKREGEPYYVVLSPDNLQKRNKYLEELAALQKKRSILFIGRLAEYAYFNMDQVIKRVIDCLTHIDV